MKTMIITGAGRGIGKAIALKFAKEGFNVTINCNRSADELKVTADEIMRLNKESEDNILTLQGDVGDYSFAEELVARTIEKFGRVDALVNNAGISYIGLLTDMTGEDWNHVLTTNLTSIFNMSKFAARDMLHYHDGRILNISSMWGNVGASMEVAYSASKGGVNSFTRALAKELAPSGISVNAIACGVIDTKMNACFTDEERTALIEEIPYCRMGEPSEVADLAYNIITGPAYLTGQIITVDGGMT